MSNDVQTINKNNIFESLFNSQSSLPIFEIASLAFIEALVSLPVYVTIPNI